MSDTAAAFDALCAECTATNRLMPMPLQWDQLFGLLKSKRQIQSGGWEPPLPLILGAWHHTMRSEKQLQFKAHLEWAQQNDQLAQIGAFLRALPEAQWCHLGEV